MSTQTIFLTAGATSKSALLSLVQEAAATSPGDPITGLAYNTSSLTAYYKINGTGTATAITLATQTDTGAYSSGGFVETSSTNAPGQYRFDIPNAVIATAGVVTVTFNGAANMATHTLHIMCTAIDLYDSVRGGMTAMPNAAAGASGGLHINGSNSGTTTYAALTVTGSFTISDGLLVSRSSSNTAAITATGNGTGNGITITSGSGATGTGLAVVAASTNGAAATFAGVGTGNGITSTGGAMGHGVSAVGGATSGDGLRVAAATSGKGLNAIGAGTTMPGILATGGATTSAGISAIGGATSGDGILTAATSGHGIVATGGGVGHGILATSGSGATGDGIKAVAASTNGNGLNLAGVGTGAGQLSTAGATGAGISLVGGATSGNALLTSYTAPTAGAPGTGLLDAGTAQSVTGTTLVMKATAAYANSELVGSTVVITGGSAGVGQRRIVTANVGTTDTLTVDTWTTTPTGTILYEIWASPPASTSAPAAANVTQWLGTACATPTIAGVPEVDLTHVGGDAQSGTDLKDFADAGYDPATNKVQGVVLVDTLTTYTGNTVQTGDSFARIGAAGAGLTAIDLPDQTMNIIGNITGNLSGSVGSVTGAVGSVTGAVGSVTGLTASNLDATISSRATPAQILTTALTEAYAADGDAGTLSQILFQLQAFLQERSVSGTTLTVKKLDGTTTAMTFTLSDATSPVSITRAT